MSKTEKIQQGKQLSNTTNNEQSVACPFRLFISHLGDRWTLKILYTLYLHKTAMRYSDLQRNIPEASSRMLSLALHQMEQHNLIVRTSFPSVPPHVEYSLSEAGADLMPHLIALSEWEKKYIQCPNHSTCKIFQDLIYSTGISRV